MGYSKKVEKNRGWYMVASLCIILAITYLSFNMLDGWEKYKESKKRLEASVASFEDLSKQYEDLKKTKTIEQSTTGYEMHVRSKFNLARPEEKVVFITSEEETQVVPQEKGIQKMFNTFKNFFN